MDGPEARLNAMAEVLQIMSRTSFELQSVLEAVVERASRLCRAQSGFIYRLDGDWYRMDVALNITPEFRAFTERSPIRADNLGTLTARVGRERRPIQVADVLMDQEYTYWEAQRIGKFRTIFGVPLIRDETVLGVLTLWRTKPEPFSEDEIALAQSFANQAAVAISNARLYRSVADQAARIRSIQDLSSRLNRLTDVQAIADAGRDAARRHWTETLTAAPLVSSRRLRSNLALGIPTEADSRAWTRHGVVLIDC